MGALIVYVKFFNKNWRKYDIVKIDKARRCIYEVYYLYAWNISQLHLKKNSPRYFPKGILLSTTLLTTRFFF